MSDYDARHKVDRQPVDRRSTAWQNRLKSAGPLLIAIVLGISVTFAVAGVTVSDAPLPSSGFDSQDPLSSLPPVVDAAVSQTLVPVSPAPSPVAVSTSAGETPAEDGRRRPPAPPIANPPAPPAPTFAAVTGFHCPSTATFGFREVGRFSDGTNGWYVAYPGGWTADGCDGRFDAMPMSGFANQDDPGSYAEWWFAVGSAIRYCDVSVYVPTSSNPDNVAGKPAQYFVQDTESGPARAGFAIDQRTNQARWANVGRFPVTGGRIVIKLVNRGEDWVGTVVTYEHIAVGPVRVNCGG